MNYPDAQKIGRLAEIDAERVFTSWSWTVGKDHIDTGYDFFVQPEVAIFRGHRFLVQVKATRRAKRGLVAKVAKNRLREYAVNPLPVFLVWSSSDDILHWLHVQPWIKQNMDRLAGNGDAGIRLTANQRLDDRATFTAYLREILKPAAESRTALTDLAQERSRYLSSIDPRLGVRVGVKNGAQSYEIFSNSQPVDIGVEIRASKGHQGGLVDAIRYGIPTTVNVDTFRMKGSALFAALGAEGVRGAVSIRPMKERKGTVTLRSGTKYSMLASPYSLAAQLYVGNFGFSVSNEGAENVLDFKLRGDLHGPGRGHVDVTMKVRRNYIGTVALQDLDQLARLGDWAFETMEQHATYMDLSFGTSRLPLSTSGENLDTMRPILSYFFVMGRLQKVAKALNSDLIVGETFVLSEEDIADIHLAHDLLKGERLLVSPGPLEFSTVESISLESTSGFYAETALELTVAGKRVGTIPIAIDLDKFTLEPTADPLRYRLINGGEGEAFMRYNYRGPTDATVARRKLPSSLSGPSNAAQPDGVRVIEDPDTVLD